MKKTYLALGDSYTIGESVDQADSFPFQLAKILSSKGIQMQAPQVIAQTGWTTDELDAAINAANIAPLYDVVTLLIGVNNQYRGRPASEYSSEFQMLLRRAIQFAGNKPERVFVLSIPDWSVTPFGQSSGRDLDQIAKEIDLFNGLAADICRQNKVSFTDITPSTREALHNTALNAEDGLHPSGTLYQHWAELLAPKLLKELTISQNVTDH